MIDRLFKWIFTDNRFILSVGFLFLLGMFTLQYTSIREESLFSYEDMLSANVQVGSGCSGTVISEESMLVLTNWHCVRNSKIGGNISVIKKDETDTYTTVTSMVSEIIYFDMVKDLALLQVEGSALPSGIKAPKMRPDPVVLGETVFAMGNPLGEYGTLMRGIVSHTFRKLPVGGINRIYFQLDPGIAGGNSGGAAYDSQGRMIGVPAAGVSGTVLGAAIPMSVVKDFLHVGCLHTKTVEGTMKCSRLLPI